MNDEYSDAFKSIVPDAPSADGWADGARARRRRRNTRALAGAAAVAVVAAMAIPLGLGLAARTIRWWQRQPPSQPAPRCLTRLTESCAHQRTRRRAPRWGI